jgi:hypothetical protein
MLFRMTVAQRDRIQAEAAELGISAQALLELKVFAKSRLVSAIVVTHALFVRSGLSHRTKGPPRHLRGMASRPIKPEDHTRDRVTIALVSRTESTGHTADGMRFG